MSSHSIEQGFREFMQDFRDLTRQHFSPLIGSTEQVSDNIEELGAQERWERDEHVENPAAITLDVEIAMAKAELRRAREWMWDARGLERMYEQARQASLDAIQALRGLRWERAQLGSVQ